MLWKLWLSRSSRRRLVSSVTSRSRARIWPGRPITAHWGIEDPAAFDGSKDDQRLFIHRTYVELERRIELFVNLDLESLDSTGLQARLDGIGNLNGRG